MVFVTITVLFIVLCILVAFNHKHFETFAINDFYDNYDTLSVPSEFYKVSAKLPEHHYTVEMNDRFFIDILNAAKSQDIMRSESKMTDVEKSIIVRNSILDRANKFLTKILNDKLVNDTLIFNNVYSKTNGPVKKELSTNGLYYIAKTDHIIYRDNKIYGVSISLVTKHDKSSGRIFMTDYKLNGFVFEDKITDVTPSNLIEDSYQTYMKDVVKKRDPKSENRILCKYYADLKKFRGINGNMQNLNCP